jgi:hypothetical protein
VRRCLLCSDTVEGVELLVTFTIARSTGVLTVDVDLCFNCSHVRKLTLAELLALARWRAQDDDERERRSDAQ